MEQAIRDRFNDKILAAARQRYGIAADAITELGGFESFIYGYSRNGRDYILRLGHTLRRSPDLIRGEVDWINYLAAGGAGVARAVLSDRDQLVELLDDGQGGHFLATAFVKAPGGPVWQMSGWRDELIIDYGRLLGRIHHLSRRYQLPDPTWKRPSWDDPVNASTLTLPADEPDLQAKADAVMTYLQGLPQDEDGYGLIHQDAHAGNFFVDENGRITLFDFDDCAYGHFVYDIAMVLFYAVTNLDEPEAFARRFWPLFWRGYREEYELDPAWLAEIPHFMKLREFDLYAVIMRDVGPDHLGDNLWINTFMQGRRERLAQDVPYLDIDLEKMTQT